MAKPLRILILEDNPTDAELIEFELAEAGFDFSPTLVKNETEFVSAIQGTAPDIILSDYDLPHYNGASALAEAKRRCPDTPFILVTGAVSEDRAIEILTQGAQDYVLKNRLQQKLAPAVRRAIAEAEERKARKKAEAELREAHRTLVDAESAARRKMEEALREIRSRECARRAFLRSRVEGHMEPDDAVPADLGVYTQRLLQELQIDRIELGTTNEELARSRNEAEALMAKQLDLYDIAPVGYFTLDPDGTILRVNLTGADLLGVVRSSLIGSNLRLQIASEDLPAFDRIFERADGGEAGKCCEVGIRRPGGEARFAQLKARWSENGKECHVTMMDITDRRRAEAALEERTQQLEEANRKLDRLTPPGSLPGQGRS
ncbi:MAG: response regulator [Deltaproteobacteria bacterium]|nr:response regulator [Deltaproteobacteria bacterium]